MSVTGTDSQVSQALLAALSGYLADFGVPAEAVYLVDEDHPPEGTTMQAVFQIRQVPGNSRHPNTGVGLQNGSVAVTTWMQNQLDANDRADARVIEVHDWAQKVRIFLHQNFLDNAVKVPLIFQTCQQVQVDGTPGWIRNTDTFSYAVYFAPMANGVVYGD